MRWLLVCSLTLLTLLVGCASLPEDSNKPLEMSGEPGGAFQPVAFTAASGTAPYSFAKSIGHGEWISCQAPESRATILVMHADRAGYSKAKFCSGWIAQAFLSQGFDVLTINRPGYGESDGAPDFVGQASLVEIEAVVPSALEAAKLTKPLTGIWGFETGAAAAALASKHLTGIKFLILGGGIYDYDETMRTTTDPYLKADLAAIKQTGGEKAFEARSITYDISGLPPTLFIYHGANDTAAPVGQAKAFVDALTSSGKHKVVYQLLVDTGHTLPWDYHRHLLEALAKQAAGG